MERQFVQWLRERLPGHPRLRHGLGDDAAILAQAANADSVVTVDLLADGVDFVLDQVDPRRIGRKALAVNLSDLAAMAARPLAAVIALNLPRRGGADLAVALYEGLLPLAERHSMVIAGGDTNSWDGPLVISITAVGEVASANSRPRPLVRSGALPGDWILVTGELGGSILGKHLDFEPRVDEALLLNENYDLHAGMDISDGLSLDLSRLCAESGCGAALNLAAIPISPAAHALAAKEQVASRAETPGLQRPASRTPLDHALGDGEDFELLLAAAPDEARRILADQRLGVRLTHIGEFVPQSGLWHDVAGARQRLEVTGFQHHFD